MSKTVVVWKQETRNGLKVFDKTFSERSEAEKFVSRLEQDANTLGKSFKLMSMKEIELESVKRLNLRKNKKKGKGWHGDSRLHGLAGKGIKTGGKRKR